MKKILVVTLLLFALPSFAWEGFDYDTDDYIEIEKGNLVRPGRDIEIFDYSVGEYRDVRVESVSSDEIEVYDYETDEYRTFDMD